MKNIILIFLILLSLPMIGLAQSAELRNDTVYYQNRTFTAGDTVTLSYGSGPKKEFIFVSIGSGFMGIRPLEATRRKSRIRLLNKFRENSGKVYARGVLIDDKWANTFLGNEKIFIDVITTCRLKKN